MKRFASTLGMDELIRKDPVLARDFVEKPLLLGNKHNRIFSEMLSILESQFETRRTDLIEKREAKIKEIESLGFKTIRVPGIQGSNWAGVSYANNLLIDDTLFVPTFGLEEAENRIISELQEKLHSYHVSVASTTATYSQGFCAGIDSM